VSGPKAVAHLPEAAPGELERLIERALARALAA